MSKQKVTVFKARKMRTMAIVTDAEFREQMKADFDKRTEAFVYKAPLTGMIKEPAGLPDEMRHFGSVLDLKKDFIKTAEDDQFIKEDSGE